MSEMEKEFKEVADKINAKIKEATKALKEANRLAQAAGLDGLAYTQRVSYYDKTLDQLSEEEYAKLEDDEEWDGESSPLKMKFDLIDVSDLETEIENGGWSTSSSYC